MGGLGTLRLEKEFERTLQLCHTEAASPTQSKNIFDIRKQEKQQSSVDSIPCCYPFKLKLSRGKLLHKFLASCNREVILYHFNELH